MKLTVDEPRLLRDFSATLLRVLVKNTLLTPRQVANKLIWTRTMSCIRVAAVMYYIKPKAEKLLLRTTAWFTCSHLSRIVAYTCLKST